MNHQYVLHDNELMVVCVVLQSEVVVLVQELLEMVLELWCQAHSILNRPLVDKSLQELGEHIAILSLAIGAGLIT